MLTYDILLFKKIAGHVDHLKALFIIKTSREGHVKITFITKCSLHFFRV